MEKEENLEGLWKKYQGTLCEECRDALIVHYLYLVKFVVGRMGASYPSHIKMEDLYSSGVTGLIRAVEKYEPQRMTKFEGYAMLLIKGAIIDELRDLDWVPRSVHQKANTISVAQLKLQQELGRDPTDEELALALGISQEELQDLLERVRPAILVPLNSDPIHADDDEGLPICERIADQNAQTGFAIADRNEFCRLLQKEIASLPEREQKVLMLYYYEGFMLKEIGETLGITESRVSQIHTKALLKLRGRLQNLLTT
ncbi:MAG: FliA/WhiG family RNA polymerase sigma factor [Verrucomicrobia bacterium]|nr:FliA/WhiG family RNA polymerase sigma factor [Verrucomicrobiota bacterium]MBS0646314.1 FliA/WhiG family RNA polymerase sigma factor [Verrucomicrobiota bacterium]